MPRGNPRPTNSVKKGEQRALKHGLQTAEVRQLRKSMLDYINKKTKNNKDFVKVVKEADTIDIQEWLQKITAVMVKDIEDWYIDNYRKGQFEPIPQNILYIMKLLNQFSKNLHDMKYGTKSVSVNVDVDYKTFKEQMAAHQRMLQKYA